MPFSGLIRNRQGSGIIETPIVLTILAMLFMFFTGFCFAYYNKAVMNMAVHEGAREYGVNQSIGTALEITRNELRLGGIKDAAVFYDGVNNKVVATKNIGFFIPMTKRYIFHLASSAEFRKESDLNYFRKGID